MARIVGVGIALLLVVSNLKGRQIGMSDGLRMAALWGFLIITLTRVLAAWMVIRNGMRHFNLHNTYYQF